MGLARIYNARGASPFVHQPPFLPLSLHSHNRTMLEEQQYQRSAAFQEHVESTTAARYTSNAQDYTLTRPTAVSPPPFIDRGASRGTYARNGRTSPLSGISSPGSISKPRTYRDWLSHAKLTSAGAMQNGFSSPVIWVRARRPLIRSRGSLRLHRCMSRATRSHRTPWSGATTTGGPSTSVDRSTK